MKKTAAAKDTQELLIDNANPEQNANVLDFSGTLRELRKTVDPGLLRKREGIRDSSGNPRTVDYVEWHTVADILDSTAPNWAHTIKDIRSIGDHSVVTVAITIDGVTREGIGTGSNRTEVGIKKAEHDALKRAAVKFGIARDLYKRELETIDGTPLDTSDRPADPIGRSISELVTPRQLGMIRALARERGVDVEAECSQLMNCRVNELSRRAASYLIDRLGSRPKVAAAARMAS
ncbi:MAG TPA: Rad52/Rad22 family DNA repair protein [Pyrinomonadaceae bacterium]|nr:Rad52/Rad22 family DNA repair protein [Pyrinomonadaceae bacterium]